MVGPKIKDQQELMKDRVRENYEYEVRFRLKKLMKKMTKMYHKCLICGTFVPQSEEFVPQK